MELFSIKLQEKVDSDALVGTSRTFGTCPMLFFTELSDGKSNSYHCCISCVEHPAII